MIRPGNGPTPTTSMTYLPHLHSRGPRSAQQIAQECGLRLVTVQQSLLKDRQRGFVCCIRPHGREWGGYTQAQWGIVKGADDAIAAWIKEWRDWQAFDSAGRPGEVKPKRIRSKQVLQSADEDDADLPVMREAPPGFVRGAIERVLRIDVERAWRGVQ
jgi:hypothetical protein